MEGVTAGCVEDWRPEVKGPGQVRLDTLGAAARQGRLGVLGVFLEGFWYLCVSAGAGCFLEGVYLCMCAGWVSFLGGCVFVCVFAGRVFVCVLGGLVVLVFFCGVYVCVWVFFGGGLCVRGCFFGGFVQVCMFMWGLCMCVFVWFICLVKWRFMYVYMCVWMCVRTILYTYLYVFVCIEEDEDRLKGSNVSFEEFILLTKDSQS